MYSGQIKFTNIGMIYLRVYESISSEHLEYDILLFPNATNLPEPAFETLSQI